MSQGLSWQAARSQTPIPTWHRYLRRARGFAGRPSFAFAFGADLDDARPGGGPSFPRNATSIPFSEK